MQANFYYIDNGVWRMRVKALDGFNVESESGARFTLHQLTISRYILPEGLLEEMKKAATA